MAKEKTPLVRNDRGRWELTERGKEKAGRVALRTEQERDATPPSATIQGLVVRRKRGRPAGSKYKPKVAA
jgi:hypothetical protein